MEMTWKWIAIALASTLFFLVIFAMMSIGLVFDALSAVIDLLLGLLRPFNPFRFY